MYEAVISKLNSGLKFGLTNHHTAELSKKLLPTYCDSTKTFTFLFDQTENTDILEILNMDPYNIEKFDAHAMDFIAFIKKDEDVKWVDNIGTKRVDKIGIKFTGYFSPEFINGDIRKYQFDRKSNICLNQEAKVYDNGSGINYPVLYSFTIAAWKLCYILDCFALNRIFELRM
ncbi:24224_t:CDS:2 [Dentiscutata erythropus]|uniref:24224_t:CDS:1 n=1 Tax=Dentiscutata erythropus TaxID=1348616 RepID=A0A9N8VY50_9GLOM|nr:24224_t:CDS:2 [Dentiscutata erythropus]